jgi:hypothetical protein
MSRTILLRGVLSQLEEIDFFTHLAREFTMCTTNPSFRLAVGLPLLCLFYLPNATAEPVTLDDLLLDQVTAGTEASNPGGSGGAIIGNSSVATISQTGGVDLEGEAQSGAKGLNIVNSAESTVANGVNIWNIKPDDAIPDSGEMAVDQSNMINQEQRRSASMPNYSRPEANTFVEVTSIGTESHDDSFDRNNNIVDLHVLTSDANNTSTASVTTTIEGGGKTNSTDLGVSPEVDVNTNVGKGGAGAGTLDLFLDGGEVQIGMAVGGAVMANPDKITPSPSGNTESYGGMDVGDADSDFTLYGRLILPEAEVHVVGSGCGVLMGSCDAGGSAILNTSETIDKSIMDTEVSSSIGNSTYTDNVAETYRSPFELTNAQAEYIVVDDSSLTVNTSFNLALSGSAQSNVKAMNVVNATGSAVANGINIARTSGLMDGGALALQQSNVISHSR